MLKLIVFGVVFLSYLGIHPASAAFDASRPSGNKAISPRPLLSGYPKGWKNLPSEKRGQRLWVENGGAFADLIEAFLKDVPQREREIFIKEQMVKFSELANKYAALEAIGANYDPRQMRDAVESLRLEMRELRGEVVRAAEALSVEVANRSSAPAQEAVEQRMKWADERIQGFKENLEKEAPVEPRAEVSQKRIAVKHGMRHVPGLALVSIIFGMYLFEEYVRENRQRADFDRWPKDRDEAKVFIRKMMQVIREDLEATKKGIWGSGIEEGSRNPASIQEELDAALNSLPIKEEPLKPEWKNLKPVKRGQKLWNHEYTGNLVSKLLADVPERDRKLFIEERMVKFNEVANKFASLEARAASMSAEEMRTAWENVSNEARSLRNDTVMVARKIRNHYRNTDLWDRRKLVYDAPTADEKIEQAERLEREVPREVPIDTKNIVKRAPIVRAAPGLALISILFGVYLVEEYVLENRERAQFKRWPKDRQEAYVLFKNYLKVMKEDLEKTKQGILGAGEPPHRVTISKRLPFHVS